MDKAAIEALMRLSELTIFELRGEWRRLHRVPPTIAEAEMAIDAARKCAAELGTQMCIAIVDLERRCSAFRNIREMMFLFC
jgi:hypothetical protein